MVTRQDYKLAWEQAGTQLVHFVVGEHQPLQADAREFLEVMGLPKSAWPGLRFGPDNLDWVPDEHLSKVEGLFPIGSDSYGNAFVVPSDGTVQYLDHDDAFSISYVNQSVARLAETLLHFRTMILKSRDLVGPDDDQIPAHLLDEFERYLREADPKALSAGSMWANELVILRPQAPVNHAHPLD